MRLNGGQRLFAGMRYELIEDSANGPWRVTTRGYMYSVERADGGEMLSAHWHPESPGRHVEPHLHVPHDMVTQEGYYLAREPLYTGRYTFEAVIRFVITNVGCAPMVSDWEERLLLAETPHRLYRSWHQTPSEMHPPP